MLDIMRKHTGSWLVKLIFALIILSFILFFGYSQMKSGGPGTNTAAYVNGEPIPYGLYKIAFENTREFYKQLFSNEIPEEMTGQIRSAALNQVINQVLLSQLAKEFDIMVPPVELYNAISKDPNFIKDGKFDSDAYKKFFLPYFERRYGMSYEDFLKNELLASKTRKFLEEHVYITEKEAKHEFDRENRYWTFERIIVPVTPPEGTKYDAEAEELAKNILNAKVSKDNKELQRLLKKYSLERETIEKINLEKKHRLLPSAEENEEVFAEIFALNPSEPTFNRPVKSGASLYILTLNEISLPDEEKWKKEKNEFIAKLVQAKKQNYLAEWLDSMKEKADIQEYVLGVN